MAESCEPCAATLCALRLSHGAANPQNSARGASEDDGVRVAPAVALRAAMPVATTAHTPAVAVQSRTVCPRPRPTRPRMMSVKLVVLHYRALAAATSAWALSGSACTKDVPRDTAVPSAAHAVPPVAPVAPPSPIEDQPLAYHVAGPEAVGRVIGQVTFNGPVPADSAIHAAGDASGCGPVSVDGSLTHRGPRLASAVVWLTGITPASTCRTCGDSTS